MQNRRNLHAEIFLVVNRRGEKLVQIDKNGARWRAPVGRHSSSHIQSPEIQTLHSIFSFPLTVTDRQSEREYR